MEPAQGQEAQGGSVAEDTILLKHRVTVSPLGIEGHVACHSVILKIPLLGQMNIPVPAFQMLTFPDGIFRPVQLFAVDGDDIVNFRAAVGLKFNNAVRGQNHRQDIGIAFIASTTVLQGHQKIFIGNGADTGSADDLQLESTHPGLGLPLFAAGEGQEVHIELPETAQHGDIRRLDTLAQQGTVLHQPEKCAVIADFVLHSVHSVGGFFIGAVEVKGYSKDIASGSLHGVLAVYRDLIPKLRFCRGSADTEHRQKQKKRQEKTKISFQSGLPLS